MRTILLLTLLFLWSCDNNPSNNDSITMDSTTISSIDTVVEAPTPPSLKVQEKILIEPAISNEDLSKHVTNWCISLDTIFPEYELTDALQEGKYKAILRTNSYGVSDTTKVPALFKKVRKEIDYCLAFSENFPENTIHEWYEDTSTTEQVSYLWFEPNME